MIKRGRIFYIKGDVCEPLRDNEHEIIVIPHCCNTLGVMGKGVALALKKKWPVVYDAYKEMESKTSSGLKYKLGQICSVMVDDHTIIVNMIGQEGIISANNPRPVKYEALVSCMREIRVNIAKSLYKYRKDVNRTYSIHTCKFGCGLAGGSFDVIYPLIQELWVDYGIDVTIYEFE